MKELGEKLGITYQTIAQWENGYRNPSLTTRIKLANVLGCEVSDLSGEEEADKVTYRPVVLCKNCAFAEKFEAEYYCDYMKLYHDGGFYCAKGKETECADET